MAGVARELYIAPDTTMPYDAWNTLWSSVSVNSMLDQFNAHWQVSIVVRVSGQQRGPIPRFSRALNSNAGAELLEYEIEQLIHSAVPFLVMALSFEISNLRRKQ